MSAQEPGPGELIVLTGRSNIQPAAAFTSVAAMRTWLQSMGWLAGHAFHRHTVPLDSAHRS